MTLTLIFELKIAFLYLCWHKEHSVSQTFVVWLCCCRGVCDKRFYRYVLLHIQVWSSMIWNILQIYHFIPTLKRWGIYVLLAHASKYVGLQQTFVKYNWILLIPTDFRHGTLIIIDVQIIPSSRVIWTLLSYWNFQDQKHILTIKRPKLHKQKDRVVLKVKSREKTQQVREN